MVGTHIIGFDMVGEEFITNKAKLKAQGLCYVFFFLKGTLFSRKGPREDYNNRGAYLVTQTNKVRFIYHMSLIFHTKSLSFHFNRPCQDFTLWEF